MKKILILLVIAFIAITLNAQTQTIVYIDNTYTGVVSTGSITQPLTALPKFTNGGKYYIKAGTTIDNKITISNICNNVLLTRYGEGKNPIIKNLNSRYKTKNFTIAGTGNKIKGIDFIVDSYAPTADNSGTANIYQNGGSLTVEDCLLIGGHPAFNWSNIDSLYIYNCHIKNFTYDAMWGQWANYIKVNKCKFDSAYIDYTNANDTFSTDIIHVKDCKELIVDSSYLDHNYSGKYCIISHTDKQPLPYYKVKLSNSTFIGKYGYSQANLRPTIMSTEIINCKILNSQTGIQGAGDTLIVKNCTFDKFSNKAIEQGWVKYQKVTDCTFTNSKVAIENKASINTNCAFSEADIAAGKGAKIIITPPVVISPVIKVDSLIIYRNVMNKIVIPGLLNKYQTKASILKQIKAVIK